MPLTTDPESPCLKNIEPNGQQSCYLVLSEEERAKGFVRPVRTSYKHVGTPGPEFELLDLTPEQHERYDESKYVKYEKYPEGSRGSAVGRFWTQEQLDKVGRACGHTTSMGNALAETYARDPHFYGGTFCSHCGSHFTVGTNGEFIWLDGSRVGT